MSCDSNGGRYWLAKVHRMDTGQPIGATANVQPQDKMIGGTVGSSRPCSLTTVPSDLALDLDFVHYLLHVRSVLRELLRFLSLRGVLDGTL